MSSRFFIPYIPNHYNEGLYGKKVLVVGASYYCNHIDCIKFKECTDIEKKDSSKYDGNCPFAPNRLLRNEPDYTTGTLPAYNRFASLVKPFVPEGRDPWEYMAFTNYVQFFLPGKKENGKSKWTETTAISNRDYNAFNETLLELQPNIVIIWGEKIAQPIRHENPYWSDEEFEETDGYISHLQIPEISHNITLLSCYHPTPINRQWTRDFEKCQTFLKRILLEPIKKNDEI